MEVILFTFIMIFSVLFAWWVVTKDDDDGAH